MENPEMLSAITCNVIRAFAIPAYSHASNECHIHVFMNSFLHHSIFTLFTSLSQANPDPNSCLGVFGLSLYTTERDLRDVFSKYGPLSDVNIVYDQQSRRSRGFAFVYFENREDSNEVWRTRWGSIY